MITQSKRSARPAEQRVATFRSEQLGGVRRNVACRHERQVRNRRPIESRCPDRRRRPGRWTDPGSCAYSNTSCMRGRRMSASITSVRCPACASATARLLATSVFPSCGDVLVTSTERDFSSGDEKITAVRIARIASENPGGVPALSSCDADLSLIDGHQTEERHLQVCLDLVRRLDAVVQPLESEHQRHGDRAAQDESRQQIARGLRQDRAFAASPRDR